VKGLTESLSIEFGRFGVRVADVLPGFIETAILGEGTAQYLPKEGMWRVIQPVEIARAVWASYSTDKERLHWFVPEEISELYARATADPEGTRKWMATESPFAMLGRNQNN
jgi:NAD(P)-dependent dehydrogenase (short-subunit alcohol dehydrogenase family)